MSITNSCTNDLCDKMCLFLGQCKSSNGAQIPEGGLERMALAQQGFNRILKKTIEEKRNFSLHAGDLFEKCHALLNGPGARTLFCANVWWCHRGWPGYALNETLNEKYCTKGMDV